MFQHIHIYLFKSSTLNVFFFFCCLFVSFFFLCSMLFLLRIGSISVLPPLPVPRRGLQPAARLLPSGGRPGCTTKLTIHSKRMYKPSALLTAAVRFLRDPRDSRLSSCATALLEGPDFQTGNFLNHHKILRNFWI